MPDRIVLNIICIQTEKQLGTLNNIQGLLKGVLTDVYARNFMHAKTSLHAHCMLTCHHVRNLSNLAMC